MNITIQDVAKKANVSVATVSRVMNGNYPVKAETRDAVLKVIEELNYIPNMQARELTKKKSSTIGVIVPSINNMFFTELITGIETELKKDSLSLILTCTNDNPDEEQNCVNNLISRNVSGIIAAGLNPSNIKSKFYENVSHKIPLVFINSEYSSSNISYILGNEALGAETALNHLKDNGHTDILFVRGKDSYSYDIKEKVYSEFMARYNYFDPQKIINIGNGNNSKTVDNTMNIFLNILKNYSFTAIFACNDLMAVGIINACKKLGIIVPDNLSIIGYDNIPLSRFIEPKLTTIDQNMFLLGTDAAKLLKEKINSNNKLSRKIILNNSLIKRETVSMNKTSNK
ncbi:MAG: LacI family DNA-binding transcriptional regulator [Clostridium sp.]